MNEDGIWKLQKHAFEISSNIADAFNLASHYQQKAKILKDIRIITKPVHTELNQYFSDVRGWSPMFGYPAINYEDDDLPKSSWSLISQSIMSSNKTVKDHYLKRMLLVGCLTILLYKL